MDRATRTLLAVALLFDDAVAQDLPRLTAPAPEDGPEPGTRHAGAIQYPLEN
jgi:hypothetical protein